MTIDTTDHASSSSEEEEEEWYAVFISNANRTVPFLRQRSGGGCSGGGGDDNDGGGRLVVWDYHVIALHRRRRAVDDDDNDGDDDGNDYYEVYDYDTTLDFPCPLSTYVDLALTIPPSSRGGTGGPLPERYRHLFRVVPADRYLAEFASDRSHMLLPPPSKEDSSSGGYVGEGEGERYSSPPPSYPCIAARDGTGETMNLDEYIDMEERCCHPGRGAVYDLEGLARRFIIVRG